VKVSAFFFCHRLQQSFAAVGITLPLSAFDRPFESLVEVHELSSRGHHFWPISLL
jgi:hypothetical protein